MNNFSKEVETRFQKKGWRMTAGVRNTSQILEETSGLVTVKEIQDLLGEEHRVDITTLYRIIERFISLKTLHEVVPGKFFRCSEPANTLEHHFMLCEHCKKPEELFLDYKDSISGQLSQEKNFLLRTVDITFHGTCGDCCKKS